MDHGAPRWSRESRWMDFGHLGRDWVAWISTDSWIDICRPDSICLWKADCARVNKWHLYSQTWSWVYDRPMQQRWSPFLIDHDQAFWFSYSLVSSFIQSPTASSLSILLNLADNSFISSPDVLVVSSELVDSESAETDSVEVEFLLLLISSLTILPQPSFHSSVQTYPGLEPEWIYRLGAEAPATCWRQSWTTFWSLFDSRRSCLNMRFIAVLEEDFCSLFIVFSSLMRQPRQAIRVLRMSHLYLMQPARWSKRS